jgi:hypothetical protein
MTSVIYLESSSYLSPFVYSSSSCRVTPELHHHTTAALHHPLPRPSSVSSQKICQVLAVQCCLLDAAVDDADQATEIQDDTSLICRTLSQK